MNSTSTARASSFPDLQARVQKPSDPIDALPCVIFLCEFGIDGTPPVFSFVGEDVKELLGVEAEAIVADGAARFRNVSRYHVERVQAGILAAIADGRPWKGEFQVTINGRQHWIEERANIYQSADGSAAVHGYWFDITERKTLELEHRHNYYRIRQTECQLPLSDADRVRLANRMDAQMNGLPMALVVADATERLTIREWNPVAEQIFGFSREETIGKSCYDLIVPAERWALIKEATRAVMYSNETLRSITANTTRDGRTIWCEWFSTPLRDECGKVIRIVSMVEKISERAAEERRAGFR